MNHSDYNQLQDAQWKRKLTVEEEARLTASLAKQPEVQANWEEEKMVAELLRQLPDAPVPSNFTAQVLLAVNRGDNSESSSGRWRWWQWFGSLRPAHWPAMAGLVVCVSFFSYHEYRSVERNKLARSVATVSSAAALPSVELLQDFEAIHRLSQASTPVDTELLAALQ
jgi:anti-sigma factor RsiW